MVTSPSPTVFAWTTVSRSVAVSPRSQLIGPWTNTSLPVAGVVATAETFAAAMQDAVQISGPTAGSGGNPGFTPHGG